MKYIKVTGCKTCPHQEYHKCTLIGCMVSKYILEKTIHPDCPLDDNTSEAVYMVNKDDYERIDRTPIMMFKQKYVPVMEATKNIKAVFDEYKDAMYNEESIFHYKMCDPIVTDIMTAIEADGRNAGWIKDE